LKLIKSKQDKCFNRLLVDRGFDRWNYHCQGLNLSKKIKAHYTKLQL